MKRYIIPVKGVNMVIDCEDDLVLIDKILNFRDVGIYHIQDREKIADFNVAKTAYGDVIHNITDIFAYKSDLVDAKDDVILYYDEVDEGLISDSPFYSVVGYALFRELLLYNFYKLNVYKEHIYSNPTVPHYAPNYYPFYFEDINNRESISGILPSIINNVLKRYDDHVSYDSNAYDKVAIILRDLVNKIDYRIFNNSSIYDVISHQRLIVINDIGSIFKLRYEESLMEMSQLERDMGRELQQGGVFE